jgi:hypothetical protein
MAASLSSLDLEPGATVTGREGGGDFGGSGVALGASAESGRITLAENDEERSQGVTTSYNDMATGKVCGVASH